MEAANPIINSSFGGPKIDSAWSVNQDRPGMASPRILISLPLRFEHTRLTMGGIADYVKTHQRWDIVLDDQSRAMSDHEWLKSLKIEGAISWATSTTFSNYLRNQKIAFVDLWDRPATDGRTQVRPDGEAIGHLAAEHFVDRGFIHFAYCGTQQIWSEERRTGFREALSLMGHTSQEFQTRIPYSSDIADISQPEQSQRDIERSALAAWLLKQPKPLAVLACNDLCAIEVAAACEQANMIVPEEVALLGVDNDAMRCAFVNPPLSSVDTNRQLIGYRAAALLDAMLSSPKTENERPSSIRIEPKEVIVRHSTDVLAIADHQIASAMNMIRIGACSGLTITDLVQRLPLSRNQLEKRFRRYIGRSPQAEIRHVQMARIKQLLIETDYPLRVIAEMAGFEYVEYLCRLFKRVTGETPGAFRRRLRPTVESP